MYVESLVCMCQLLSIVFFFVDTGFELFRFADRGLLQGRAGLAFRSSSIFDIRQDSSFKLFIDSQHTVVAFEEIRPDSPP